MPKDIVRPFTSTGVATVYTAMTGSPYSVTKDSVLKSAEIVVGSDAVTTLVETVAVKLSSKQWGDREIIIMVSGNGLRTAPAMHIPTAREDNIDLPCPLGTSIVAEYIHITGATPVTPRINCNLIFEN